MRPPHAGGGDAGNDAGGDSEAAQAQRAVVHFMGLAMGLALRTRACLSLDLAGTFWEQLVDRGAAGELIAALEGSGSFDAHS